MEKKWRLTEDIAFDSSPIVVCEEEKSGEVVENIVCVSSSGDDEDYEVKLHVNDYTDFDERDYLIFEHRPGEGSSGNCEDDTQGFELTISLYNSKPIGTSYEMDDTRPIVYNGDEQEIVFDFEAYCKVSPVEEEVVSDKEIEDDESSDS